MDRSHEFVQSLEQIHQRFEKAIEDGEWDEVKQTRTDGYLASLNKMHPNQEAKQIMKLFQENIEHMTRIKAYEFIRCDREESSALVCYQRASRVVEGTVDFYVVIFREEAGAWKMGESGSAKAKKPTDKNGIQRSTASLKASI